MKRSLLILILQIVLNVTVDATADEFPTSVRGQTVAQLGKLVEAAPAAAMTLQDLQMRVVGNRLLFDAEFVANPDKTPWTVQINIDQNRMKTLSRQYQEQGYQLQFARSVRVGPREYFTGLWKKESPRLMPLTLPEGPLPVTGPEFAAMQPLDEMMTNFLREQNAAGATLAVAKDGRLLYSRGFGFADLHAKQPMAPDALMRIASISKPVTAVAVMMLQQRGKLKLDDRVLPFLYARRYPKLKPEADARWADITIRQLLQHSGGFDRKASSDPMFEVSEVTAKYGLRRSANIRDLIKHELTQPLDFDPGQKYAYSNFGYCLLGRVIEAVSEQDYAEFVEKEILKPLGMTQTKQGRTRLRDRGVGEARYHMQNTTRSVPFWSTVKRRKPATSAIEEVEAPYGQWDLEVMDSHGAWVSSAPDLLRFVSAMDSAKDPLLNSESLLTMIQQPELTTPISPQYWYGCGWSVRPKVRSAVNLDGHNIWHSGAVAGTSTILVRRYDGFCWAVLFNTDKSKNGQQLSSVIDPLVHRAVDAVDEWPDHDLFSR